MDLANWMRNLPSELHNLPLTWLAIPGSHDSFSYSITPSSDIAPDERRLQCLNNCLCFSPIIKRLIFQWTLTQSLICKEQLSRGVRYFDFRMAARIGTLTPYVVHGMYGCSAVDILQEIGAFLDAHTTEVVLLDFQHFYNFTDEMHEYLLASVKRIFGSKLCPFSAQPQDIAPANLWANGHQVLLFYRDSYAGPTTYVWPGKYIPNPWPDTARSSRLVTLLEANYEKGRNPNLFYVTQGVLTPDVAYILFRFFTSLKSNLAPAAHRVLQQWLDTKAAGKGGINIVMADFIDMPPFNFSENVIKLNWKLAETMKLSSK